MVPLETEFGWNRAAISVAVAINIALFGLIGPFAASVMDRVGLRRVILCALALLALSVALTTRMQHQWELTLLWGILVGAGTGVTSMVLAAVVASRWFDERRGLVMGGLSGANATGQLIFLPLLASLVEQRGWRAAAWTVAGAAEVVFGVVLLFMRNRPEDLGLLPYGRRASTNPDAATPALAPMAAPRYAARTPAFWVLAGTFFICGASTNGLIGTTASGWLTDRYSSRHLLFGYYALRGLSLLYLPVAPQQGAPELGWCAMFYGLDWVATVPPTVRLTSDVFGRENTGVIYGWIGASHQLGASLAAFGAGAMRTVLGNYDLAFWVSSALCLVAGASFLAIGRRTFISTPIDMPIPAQAG